MRKKFTATIAKVLTMSLVVSLLGVSTDVEVEAAKKKIRLSKKSVSLTVGKSKKIKIKNVKKKKIKKLTVKCGKKTIAKVKKVGNKKTVFRVTGKKEGTTKVRVILKLKGKKTKKFTLKVKVKAKKEEVPVAESKPTPEVQATSTPEVQATATPEVQATETPEVQATSTPEVQATETPEVQATSTPEVQATSTPEVQATATPEVQATSTPKVQATATPEVQATSTPEVQATATPEVQATSTPEVQATSTPEVQATPTPEVGDSGTLAIESVMVEDNITLYATMNQKTELVQENITIKTKATENGAYGEALDINSVEKIDYQQFKIVLKNQVGNYIVNNGYVQISITQNGARTLVAEGQYEQDNSVQHSKKIMTATVGATVNKQCMNLYNNTVGTIQHTISEGELPEGMRLDFSGKTVYFRGTPEEVGTSEFVLTVTDEVGDKWIFNCICYVVDETTLYATAEDGYAMDGESVSAYVHAAGGSGSYTYTKVEGENDFTVNSNGKVTMPNAKAGTYQVYVDVADAANPELKTRVKVVLDVAATYKISGKLSDLGGGDIEFLGGAVSIYLVPHDKEISNRYFSSGNEFMSTDNNSGFYESVPAGIYDIHIFVSDAMYKIVKDVEVTNQAVDVGEIVLPACQVTLEAPNEDNLYMIYWHDENDKFVGRNASFLVRPGTYTIHSDTDSSPVLASLYDFTATFTVTDKSITKLVTATPRPERVPEIKLGTPVTTTLDGVTRKAQFWKFTPEETGTYRLYTTDADEMIDFYFYSDKAYSNSDKFYLTVSTYTFTCSGGNQVDRTMTLQKGTTYYIKPYMIWDEVDELSFVLEKAE